MRNNALRVLCLVVLGTIFALGLSPFHAPKNDVTWLENRNGLRLGRYGNIATSRPLEVMEQGVSEQGTLEIWLRPRSIWDSNTFLAIYDGRFQQDFSIRQNETGVLLKAAPRGKQPVVLSVDNVFRQGSPALLTLTFGTGGARVYIDGVLAKNWPSFPLRQLAGRLVLGDSPYQPDSWSGRLFGLAIYPRELTAKEISDHYLAWNRTGRPGAAAELGQSVLYTFDERRGRVVHDRGTFGADLYIPDVYTVQDKIALEPFWEEFELSRSYFSAAVKNIVGFVPLGFCFYAWFLTLLPSRRAKLATLALGFAVSLTIEVLQIFLPTRDSGTTDIFTNTFGTWIGVVLYEASIPILRRVFPGILPAPLSFVFLQPRRAPAPKSQEASD